MIRIRIPSPLHSYTRGRSEVEIDSAVDLDDLTRQLDAAFPGLRFRIVDEHDRIRRHIQIFVNTEQVRDLKSRLRPGDQVMIAAALSGG